MTEELIEDWYKSLMILRGLAESSLKIMERRLRGFAAYLQAEKNQELLSATQNDIEDYMEYLFYIKNAAVTRSAKLAAVNSFFSHMLYRGHISVNPAERIIRPQTFKKHVQSFSRTEVRAVFGALQPETERGLRNTIILILGFFCGFRVSEIQNIRLCDVVDNDGLVTVITQSYEGFTPKRHSDREHQLWRYPSELILRHIAIRVSKGATGDDLLIVSRSGKKLTTANINSLLQTMCRKAGVTKPQISTHMMRATCLTSLRFIKSYDVFAIAQMAGHKNIETTGRYIKSWGRINREYASQRAYWEIEKIGRKDESAE